MTQTSKKILLFLSIALTVSCIAHADAASARHQVLPNLNPEHNIKTETGRSGNNFFTLFSDFEQPIKRSFAKLSFRKQGKASSAAEAAQIAKQRHGGKVLSVSKKKSGDGIIYRVKLLLENGRVKTVTISG
ncbi:MAG: hypothetical protein K6L75_10425 [Cellvibrionaceae bacterium]